MCRPRGPSTPPSAIDLDTTPPSCRVGVRLRAKFVFESQRARDEEMDAISRYAAAIAAMTTTTPSSPSCALHVAGRASRSPGAAASTPAVRAELLPAVRPVSARRGNANVSVDRPGSGASARSSASNATAAAARRRLEEVQAEEDRAFEEKLARVEARYREEKARGDARGGGWARDRGVVGDTAVAFEEERVESSRGAGSGMGNRESALAGGVSTRAKVRQTPPAVLPLWSPDANKGGIGSATHSRSLRGRAEESRASRRRLQVA